MRTWVRSDEVASRESVEVLESRLKKLERAREREQPSRQNVAPIGAGLLSLIAILVLAFIPPPQGATVEQYFAQLVGLGAVFVAGAGVAHVLHLIWPESGWEKAEHVVKTAGLIFLAVIALARFGF